MRRKTRDFHAKLVVYDYNNMLKTKGDVKRLVRWLKKLSDDMAKPPKEGYYKIFTARLMK